MGKDPPESEAKVETPKIPKPDGLKQLQVSAETPKYEEAKAKGLIPKFGRWTGFGEKKLWDFLELLIVPAVLAIGAFYLEEQASNRQEQIATARYQQEALAKYFDQMTQLLLEKKLRQPGSEAQVIARARTLSTLGELDETRKGLLLKFLYEAKLISQNQQNKTVISLIDANLSLANLEGAGLEDANLRGANLEGTGLEDANLRDANLKDANLEGANLRSASSLANLKFADLTGANLKFADLTGANLESAGLFGANLESAGLFGANLESAGLFGADLEDAYLEGADLEDAYLKNTDLSKAKNLEPGQVKAAKSWEQAKYSPDFRRQLGLPAEAPVIPGSRKSTP